VRFGRTFKTGPASIKTMIDLYNALNTSVVVAYNNSYGTNGAAGEARRPDRFLNSDRWKRDILRAALDQRVVWSSAG
jgi:hypothetical protein